MRNDSLSQSASSFWTEGCCRFCGFFDCGKAGKRQVQGVCHGRELVAGLGEVACEIFAIDISQALDGAAATATLSERTAPKTAREIHVELRGLLRGNFGSGGEPWGGCSLWGSSGGRRSLGGNDGELAPDLKFGNPLKWREVKLFLECWVVAGFQVFQDGFCAAANVEFLVDVF